MSRLLIADDEIVDRLGLERMTCDLFPDMFSITTVGSAMEPLEAARE